MVPRKLFIAEALLLISAPLLFLAFTLPEVWRATAALLTLRQASEPQVGLLQAWSGVFQWSAGAYALVVVAFLAAKTARRRSFRFGPAFWVGLIAGAGSTVLMYGPFGPFATAAVAGPSALLAAHSAYLQVRNAHAA
jgi:hypothetical protein